LLKVRQRLWVYNFNTASLALHEKLGFVREGMPRRMVYTGGQHHDIVAFGLIADEFAARYPELAAPW
jgi:RimJ/RimL family protein N-acetyltransferase